MDGLSPKQGMELFGSIAKMLPKKLIVKMLKDACDKYLANQTEATDQQVTVFVELYMTNIILKSTPVEKLADEYETFRNVRKATDDVKEVLAEKPAFGVESDQDAPEPDWDNLAKYKDAEDHGPENYPD